VGSNWDDCVSIRDSMIKGWIEYWQDETKVFSVRELAESADKLISRIQQETHYGFGDKDTIQPVIEAVIAVAKSSPWLELSGPTGFLNRN
jgi:hypothetical protein